MKNVPNSRPNLDKAIQRFAGNIVKAIVKGEVWDRVYEEQKGSLPVLNTVDEAVLWANELIEKIDNA
jgi:hypothetical protein